MIHFVLIQTRTGKPRLAKYVSQFASAQKAKMESEIAKLIANTRPTSTAFFEYGNFQIIFRRYAGLYFILAADPAEPRLPLYEFIQLFVETLDGYFGNVCELDLVFRFDRALLVLDELLLAGEVTEIDRSAVISVVKAIDRQE